MNTYFNWFIEFIGTFLFLLTIIMSTSSKIYPTGNAYAPLAISAALLVVIYIGGAISGGHFNPAVTCMFSANDYLNNDLTSSLNKLPYIVAQLVGAASALGVYRVALTMV